MTGKFLVTGAVACLLLLSAGCGGSAPPPTVDESVAGIQTAVANFVAKAQDDPKGPSGDATLLIEQLDGRVAEYGDRFRPVLDEARKFQELRVANASPSELESQLESLGAAASQL